MGSAYVRTEAEVTPAERIVELERVLKVAEDALQGIEDAYFLSCRR